MPEFQVYIRSQQVHRRNGEGVVNTLFEMYNDLDQRFPSADSFVQ